MFETLRRWWHSDKEEDTSRDTGVELRITECEAFDVGWGYELQIRGGQYGRYWRNIDTSPFRDKLFKQAVDYCVVHKLEKPTFEQFNDNRKVSLRKCA